MSPAEVTEKLGLHRMRDRSWYVHPRYASFISRGVSSSDARFAHVQLCHDGRGSVRRPSVAITKREEAATVSDRFFVALGLSASPCCVCSLVSY